LFEYLSSPRLLEFEASTLREIERKGRSSRGDNLYTIASVSKLMRGMGKMIVSTEYERNIEFFANWQKIVDVETHFIVFENETILDAL